MSKKVNHHRAASSGNRQSNKSSDTNISAGGSDRDLPGYPHYPASEDIMNPENGLQKVGGDVEDLANSNRLSGQAATSEPDSASVADAGEEYDDLGIVSGTEADVTKEDLIILGDRNADQDLGDDESIRGSARVDRLDEDEDLDIPGTELDDANEEVGEEDEENNYYSLGSDRGDALEEDKA